MASAKTPRVCSTQARMLFKAPAVANGTEKEMSVEDFVSLSKSTIGEGAFSEVYKVRNKSTEKIYAIKVISKSLVQQKQLVQQLEREVRIMYVLDHPYIIKIFTHFEDDRNVYVVMEYAAGGHMFKQLRRLREFDERTAAQYLRELVSALQYLHSRDPPIIHRDIKPENILLDAEGRSKLADFGWSNYYVDDATRDTYCGTLDYLAPEMVNRAGHTVKLDIWSLGILLFEMLAGRAPFEAKQKEALFDNIRKLKLKFPMTFPTLAKDLVRKLLRINPEERITLEELLAHQWMRTTQPLRPLITPGSQEIQISLTESSSLNSSRTRPGSGYSSPKSSRAKTVPQMEGSPQFQERMRVVRTLLERIRTKEEEVKKMQEGNKHLQVTVNDVGKQCEKVFVSAGAVREKCENQAGRLRSIQEQLARAKERSRAAKKRVNSSFSPAVSQSSSARCLARTTHSISKRYSVFSFQNFRLSRTSYASSVINQPPSLPIRPKNKPNDHRSLRLQPQTESENSHSECKERTSNDKSARRQPNDDTTESKACHDASAFCRIDAKEDTKA